MIVKFKKLSFKNIMSFGNNQTEIIFQNGISLISGKNGSGKSAILDALSFCLFGQPYRKIKIKELINRKNKNKLEVTCEFTVDEKDEIIITRSLNPDNIEIHKNGKELELLSSKRLNQEEIDKIIGINHQMFKQVISLAVNYNKPFLSLQLFEKREIIEQIFNIVIFGQMLKYLKKNNVKIKTQNEINDRTIKILEENLKSLRKRITDITETQKNFQSDKENDLKNIDEKIKQYLNEKINTENQIQNINTSMNISDFDELILEDLKSEREYTIKKINENEYSIKNSNKMIELLNKNKNCPFCKTNITEEHKNKEISRISKENTENTQNVEELKIKRTNIEKEIEKIENWKQQISDFKNKKVHLQEKLEIIEREISNTEERRNDILQREIDFNIESLNKEFNEKKIQYKTIWNETKNIKKTLKNNDIIQIILSESGMKAYFFKKLIPILNSKINEYIKLFELPVIIQFDELMNEKITNLENLKNQISYYAYSEGEKKRIDMAILLSFISITKTISNWNCNLLMIDELLDSAIDEGGLEKMVGCLKNLINESTDSSIYIISHRIQQDYTTNFKKCLEIQKNNNGFSEILNKENLNG